MGMAPAAHVLFSRFFSCNPKNPSWINRDRFVLSNGHACALQCEQSRASFGARASGVGS